mmetsp:Transcript_26903/g.53747  ORF Transcript_26903/g.53747 Transcript_26903/m.53747 type:complete len:186 (-) Transcript_26903:267-824(-)
MKTMRRLLIPLAIFASALSEPSPKNTDEKYSPTLGYCDRGHCRTRSATEGPKDPRPINPWRALILRSPERNQAEYPLHRGVSHWRTDPAHGHCLEEGGDGDDGAWDCDLVDVVDDGCILVRDARSPDRVRTIHKENFYLHNAKGHHTQRLETATDQLEKKASATGSINPPAEDFRCEAAIHLEGI